MNGSASDMRAAFRPFIGISTSDRLPEQLGLGSSQSRCAYDIGKFSLKRVSLLNGYA